MQPYEAPKSRPCLFHGENRGSIPLGRANENNELALMLGLVPGVVVEIVASGFAR